LPWWEKLLYLLVAVIVATVWWSRAAPQHTVASFLPATAAPQEQKVAALPPPRIEEPPPAPPVPLRQWTVLFNSPTSGQSEVSRRPKIQIFFNRPVEREVIEWAFTISPATRGGFAWPRPDHLVFTPQGALLPDTEYTISLTPVDGSREKEPYELLEARWSFTTGQARTYGKDIQPLIDSYCATCHGSSGSAAGVPLGTYRDVSRYVVPGRSGESRFYTFIQERRHHINMAGPDHSTSTKLVVIRDWIDEDKGAR
jgi:hypothetical protein